MHYQVNHQTNIEFCLDGSACKWHWWLGNESGRSLRMMIGEIAALNCLYGHPEHLRKQYSSIPHSIPLYDVENRVIINSYNFHFRVDNKCYIGLREWIIDAELYSEWDNVIAVSICLIVVVGNSYYWIKHVLKCIIIYRLLVFVLMNTFAKSDNVKQFCQL